MASLMASPRAQSGRRNRKTFEPISLCGELSELLNLSPDALADKFGCSPRPCAVKEVRGPIDWRVCGEQDAHTEE